MLLVLLSLYILFLPLLNNKPSPHCVDLTLIVPVVVILDTLMFPDEVIDPSVDVPVASKLPVILASPTTSKRWVGFVVPIPTLHKEYILPPTNCQKPDDNGEPFINISFALRVPFTSRA